MPTPSTRYVGSRRAASGIGAACALRFAQEGAAIAGFDLNKPDGSDWEELTMVQVPAGETSLTVRLTDDANTWVYADAVHLSQVVAPEVHVTVGGQPLASGQTLAISGTAITPTHGMPVLATPTRSAVKASIDH